MNNKKTLKSLFERVWNNGELEVVGEFVFSGYAMY